ncbi:MAG: metallophosphoesterase [Cyanophyceae cyanobacterium]
MKFVSDPPISKKIDRMKRRVRWQEKSIAQHSIDQTRLEIDDSNSDTPEFSFLVLGDTGSGTHPDHHPQRKIAELMLPHLDSCRFVLHTGDVIYQVGSSEYYPKNFIEPYRELIVGGESPQGIKYDRMVFRLPFLPVPGNHDYYELPLVYGFLAQVSWPLRHLFKTKLDLGVGWHGSGVGEAYAKAFLDCLKDLRRTELEKHLEQHYAAKTDTGRCLRYEPGHFTRLPNRYYTFRYGGIDFFALDSNTFNSPEAIPDTQEGNAKRQNLLKRQKTLEEVQNKLMQKLAQLDANKPEEAEQIDDCQGKLNQIEEAQLDIEKQLEASPIHRIDYEQLDWFQVRLVASWHNPEVRGRVVFFHHPPYVTEQTKWDQSQTLEIRDRLRGVFNTVRAEVKDIAQERPVVDLVLSGHAHCLEHLSTVDTGHADSYINWLVCGGSGHSLRRQRPEGDVLTETHEAEEERKVARSHLFVGRNGHGANKRRPYSCLRIDVLSGTPPKFVVRPIVAERYQRQWIDQELYSFTI